MESLFEDIEPTADSRINSASVPLADRVRPRKREEVVGQEHLLSEGGSLYYFFEQKKFPSIILWGPPGTGKTTLAQLIAEYSGGEFIRLSAVESGAKELRTIIEKAKRNFPKKSTVVFIDEIHRFNKAQQDLLLHAVEKGIIVLIGATTENPSFEINNALLSRCSAHRLHSLSDLALRSVIERALKEDIILKNYSVNIEHWEALTGVAGGDARMALNIVENAVNIASAKSEFSVNITLELIQSVIQRKLGKYDKRGEYHYDVVSAFIKSMRGSDPDAAMLWLAIMLDSGEDPLFIARRMVIFASEDIGNADPSALPLAVSVYQASHFLGMPECRISLAQGVAYLASCPKSNASYTAIAAAAQFSKMQSDLTVPLHLRNAPTQLMKNEGFGKAYQYPHDFPGGFVRESYFPDSVEPQSLYIPTKYGKEKVLRERLQGLWGRLPEE